MPRQASEWGGFQRSSSIIEFVPISVANQLTSSMSRALYVISALSKSHHGRGITITQKGALKNRALKGDPELNDPVAKFFSGQFNHEQCVTELQSVLEGFHLTQSTEKRRKSLRGDLSTSAISNEYLDDGNDGVHLDVAELRMWIGLGVYSPETLEEVMERRIQALGGVMDAKHFHQFVRDLNGYTEEQFDSLPLSVRTRILEIIHLLFKTFDRNGDHKIYSRDIHAAIEELEGKQFDKTILEAFTLFNASGDGFITREEMRNLVMQVFSRHFSTEEDPPVPLHVLAQITADQYFEVADTAHDGRISLREFKKWWLHPKQRDFREMLRTGNLIQAAKSSLPPPQPRRKSISQLPQMEPVLQPETPPEWANFDRPIFETKPKSTTTKSTLKLAENSDTIGILPKYFSSWAQKSQSRASQSPGLKVLYGKRFSQAFDDFDF